MNQNQLKENQLQEFLSAYSSAVQAISLELRQLVFQGVPEAIEQLDLPAKMLAYGFDRGYRGMICVIMPLNSAVNFGFPRGVELSDPGDLLEGTGKRARHVKIKEPGMLERSALLGFVKASASLAKTALRSKRGPE